MQAITSAIGSFLFYFGISYYNNENEYSSNTNNQHEYISATNLDNAPIPYSEDDISNVLYTLSQYTNNYDLSEVYQYIEKNLTDTFNKFKKEYKHTKEMIKLQLNAYEIIIPLELATSLYENTNIINGTYIRQAYRCLCEKTMLTDVNKLNLVIKEKLFEFNKNFYEICDKYYSRKESKAIAESMLYKKLDNLGFSVDKTQDETIVTVSRNDKLKIV